VPFCYPNPIDLDWDSLAATLCLEEKRRLIKAGHDVRECMRVLEKAGLNLVGELLRGQGEFIEFRHYPDGDVFDMEYHSQYYYHAHGDRWGEHGHFHTFLRTGSLIGPPLPAPRHEQSAAWPERDAAVAHLIGISMDEWGQPLGLFACNRWVTGETWYSGDTLMQLLPQFRIDHAWPSWPTNRWLSAFLDLFSPAIRMLFKHRDRLISARQQEQPGRDVLEDRQLEILASASVSIDAWMYSLEG